MRASVLGPESCTAVTHAHKSCTWHASVAQRSLCSSVIGAMRLLCCLDSASRQKFQAYLLQEMFAAELARRAGTKMQQQHRSMLQYKDVGELFIKPDLLSAG